MASCFPKQTLLQYFSTSKYTTGLNTPILYYTTRQSSAAPATEHKNPTSPNAAPATKSHTSTSPNQMLHLPRKVTQPHHEAAQVILQRLQMLRLPRKIALMINALEAWSAIYNAQSSTSHPPTSRNAVPATKNTSHDQSSRSMKRYLQCARQHKASSNVSKCCACHEKSPTSRNAVPATKNTSHDQSSWSMKCHQQCAKQHKASSNVTKCCACHEKYLSWSILLKHEMLFTMRKAAQGILQRHQMLRLPRKIALMINPLEAWKTLFRMREAAQGIIQRDQMLRLPSKMSLQTRRQFGWKLIISIARPMRAWSETDPTIKTQAANPPRNRGFFSR